MQLAHEPYCPTRRGETNCECRHRPSKSLPKVRYCSFACYSDSSSMARESLSLEQIVNLSLETHDLWARVENSGSESSYVEVARWSHDREQWERYAFQKMLDVEFLDDNDEPIELTGDEKAERFVELINCETDFSFIHGLPTWQGSE